MTVYKEFNFGGKQKPFGVFGPIIGLALFFIISYFLISGVFKVLTWLTPALLIIAAVLDYTVFVDYFKFIIKLLKENPLFGLIAILCTALGYPFVSGYLLAKAWIRYKIKKHHKDVEKEKNTFTDYEEIKEDKEDDFLILPNMPKPAEKRNDGNANDYDNLFK